MISYRVNKIIFRLCLAILLTTVVTFTPIVSVLPQTMNTKSFQYFGSGIFINESLISWEPTPSVALTPGFHTHFYGSPDRNAPCAGKTQDGQVIKNFPWKNSYDDTGISDGAEKYTPSCGNWQGSTYARVKSSPQDGGIGLYTHTGIKPLPYDLSPSFWRPYPSTGDGSGVNKYIQGTFSYFRFNPYTPLTLLRPWTGNSMDNNLRRVAFRTNQKVIKAQVQGSSSTQVQQQIQFTVLNLDCIQNKPFPSAPCQFQILAYTFIKRVGNDYPSGGTVYTDAAQGGIPAIHGDIKAAGQSTIMNCPNYGCNNSVWTSWSEKTQNSPWPNSKTFQIEISFNQLMNILSVTTAAYYKKSFPSISDITSLYGFNYNNPQSWILLDVGFSQEVYNPDVDTNTVFIGGNMTSLEVYALPF